MTVDVNNEKGAKIFRGLSINPGRVVAPVCLYSAQAHRAVSEYSLRNDTEVQRDLERFDKAMLECSADLDRIHERVVRDVGQTEAEIFLTQKHILNDPAIVKAITDGVTDKKTNVESVIVDVYNSYEEKFAALDDAYLRERSTDIGEIRRRLIDNLRNTKSGFICQGQTHCSRGRNRIIVAEELTADMMVHMDLDTVLGIVTEHGGISSHAAIIARSVGVPAVSGVHNVMQHVTCGTKVLVDGDEGRIYVNPTKEQIDELVPTDPVITDSVCHIATPTGMAVMANASLLEDVRHAARVKADGIGLFRTEIFFMRQDKLVSEDDQFQYYSDVRNIMGDLPVTFRLLDVGGDKPLPFLRLEKETNPYLGWRGARFLLGSPDILAAQVGALARLSQRGKVRIMFPMVVDALQLQELCDAVRSVIASREGILAENIELGAMFEVPSACLQAESILRKVEFGSIGSNDLIQYLFAVDRNNENVSQDYNPEHPVLWEVLRNISAAAQKTGKTLSICGEMAARRGVAKALLDIGIAELSVSPRLVPRVRDEMAVYAQEHSQLKV